ncbi:hypothetical protein D3C84_938590 [compost metagenome]
MPLSNILATLDSKGLVDWYRVVEMLSHMAFAVAMYFWFRSDSRAAEVMVLTTLSAVAMYFFVLVVAWNQAIDPATYDWVRRPPFFRNIRQCLHCCLSGDRLSAVPVRIEKPCSVLALVVHCWIGRIPPFSAFSSRLSWNGLVVGIVSERRGSVCGSDKLRTPGDLVVAIAIHR